MTISTARLPELLWPGLLDTFGETYDQWEPLWNKFFEVKQSNKAFEKVQGVTSLPIAGKKDQGSEVQFVDMNQGFQKEYVNITYAIGVNITMEMVEDEQYDIINQIPEMLGESIRHTEEIVAHNVLNNGFDSAFAGPDGLSLFNASHPNVATTDTQSNRPTIASDLSQTSLEQGLIDVMNFRDDQNKVINVRKRKLVVPTQLGFTAEKILSSEYVTGSANNDRNVIAGALDLVVTPYLTDPNAWFIINGVRNGLTFVDRKSRELDRRNGRRNKDEEVMAFRRFSVGFSDWRGAYGSPGAS